MRTVLSGIVVADFSRVLAGPLATAALGDLGATVIKVEGPGGDETRAWGPPFVDGESSYYLSANRNKRSITLDLKDPADRHRARQLAGRADILVENFRPGVAERLGLGYEDLRAVNPGLVYASITGFGREAPGRDLAGYDFLVQALSGLMSITGDADGEPAKVGVAVVDVLTGLHLQAGVLAALYERASSGNGQRVDVTLLGAALAGLVNQASAWLTAGMEPRRSGNVHPSIAPYETLTAADGQLVLAVGNDGQFARLADTLGRRDLIHDARYATNPDRVANRPDLRRELEDTLRTATVGHWVEVITRAGVACGRVNSIPEAFGFASVVGQPPMVVISRDDGSPVRQVVNPLSLSRTPVSYRLAPPRLGEHNAEIRQWLDDVTSQGSQVSEGTVTS